MSGSVSRAGAVQWWLYATFATGLYVCAWPFLAALARWGSQGWRERLGRPRRSLPRRALWIHAASVGEVNALGPLLREIRARRQNPGVVISTMTEAGKSRAKAAYRLPTVLAPLDSVPCVRRWIETARPRALFVMETELWPVWLDLTSRVLPVAWINGRISDRSYPRYRLVGPLLARIFSAMRLLCVIGARDSVRARKLGAPASRVRVMGNVKSDMEADLTPAKPVPPGLWLAAGSTRSGEERVVLEAFRRVRRRFPRARLCLAPRHIERGGELRELAAAMDLGASLRSGKEKETGDAEVLVLDTHGELRSFYRRCAAAFVGGTLVKRGGHNVLEPALAGVPVLFGPHTANVREETEGLIRTGGGFRVNSADSLAKAWLRFLKSRRARTAAGRRARDFVLSRRGVAARLVRLLAAEGLI